MGNGDRWLARCSDETIFISMARVSVLSETRENTAHSAVVPQVQ